MEEKIQLIDTSWTSSNIRDTLRDLFEELMSASTVWYILIDGLDQCEARGRKDVLNVLSMLVSSSNNIRLFLSSHFSLRDEFEKIFPSMERLTLDCKDTELDIETYVVGLLKEKLDEGDFTIGDPTLVSDLQSALVSGAQGM